MGHGDGPLSTATLPAPRWLRAAWVVPAAFLLIFLVIPLAILIARTWSASGLHLLASSDTAHVVALSALQALLSTILAMGLGLPIAMVIARYDFRGRAFVRALATVPFVMPTVVVAMAFRSLLGTSLPSGLLIVVIAHAYVNLAVVVRIVGAQADQQDLRYLDTARTLGATPLTALRTITLPYLRPALASAAVVVFIFSFTSLGIVLLLGDSSTRTLESQILRRTTVLLDFPGAAALALLQLVLIGVVIAVGGVLGRNRGRTLPVTSMRTELRALSARMRRASRAVIIAAAIIVLAPIIALVVESMRSSSGWTLQWWGSVGSIDAGTSRIGSPLAAIGTSLMFALITGVIAGTIGTLAAIAVIAHRRGRFLAAVAVIPLGISAATLGLGLFLAYGRPPVDLRASGLLIPLAHSLVAVPLVVAVIAPALRTVDPRLQSAAATLGAAPTRAFLAAYGPTLRVVMLASAGLACAVSLGEFGAASFLARTGSPTVPLQIARLLGRPGEQSFGVAAVLSVILAALTLALVLGVDRLGERGRITA